MRDYALLVCSSYRVYHPTLLCGTAFPVLNGVGGHGNNRHQPSHMARRRLSDCDCSGFGDHRSRGNSDLDYGQATLFGDGGDRRACHHHDSSRDRDRVHGHSHGHDRIAHPLCLVSDQGSPVDSQASCHVCKATAVSGHPESDDGDRGPPLQRAVPWVASF